MRRYCAATLAFILGLASCGPSSTSSDAGTSSTTGEPTAGPSTTSGVDTGESTVGESTTTVTTSVGESQTTEDPTTEDDPFIAPYDIPCGWDGTNMPRCSVDCSTYDQDCPEGMQCTPYADDGGSSWNALWCFDITGTGTHGDPCTAVESGVSGQHDCGFGHMCWDIDPDTLEGTCVAFCQGSPQNPWCEPEGAVCVTANAGILNVCLDVCDPLVQECPQGQGCYAVSNSYICAPSGAPEDLGNEDDPCEFLQACNPGLYCAAAEKLPSCEMSLGCCTPFCDLDNPDCQDPEKTCVPVWEQPQAGEEHIGFCGVAG